MLAKDIDEIVNDTEVMMALNKADHFYITFFNKSKRQNRKQEMFLG